MGTATTFAALIANPESEKVFLAEIHVAKQATGFTLANGQTNTYKYTDPNTVVCSDANPVLNGDFETAGAGGADVFASWTEIIEGGTSTITRDAVAPITGPASCKFVIDAGGDYCFLEQGFKLLRNELYRLSFKHKTSAGTASVRRFDLRTADGILFIKEDGTWNTGSYFALQPQGNGVTQTFSVDFRSRPDVEDYLFYPYAGDADDASKSVWFDDITITRLTKFEPVTLADGSTERIDYEIDRVEIDGTALTSRATVALVEANASSYLWDSTSRTLFVHCSDSGSPNNNMVIVYFWLYFATKGIILNSKYYEPYIAGNGIPSISKRLSEIHYGTSEMGGGTVVLLNGRGYFDQIAKSFIWTNKTIKLLLGGDSLAYAEYSAIFTGKIIQASFTKQEFALSVRAASYDLLRDLPINDFWTSTYANLDPLAEGIPIPYYWGVYDINQAPVVTCINSAYAATTYQFKICDTTFHAIKSITQVYVDYGAGVGWQTIAHANEDLALATFTINTASFVLGTSRVKVAFEGYHSGGVLIEGAPEVAEDLLLNQCGYAAGDLNAPSFTASKAESTCTLNVFVDSSRTAISVIEQICASDIAYFDDDGDGLLRYRTFTPAVSTAALTVIDATDILEIPTIWEDYNQLYYRVKVGYSYLCNKGTYLYKDETDYDALYKYGKRETLTIQTYLRTATYADNLAVKLSMIVKDIVSQIRLKLKVSLIEKEIGDQIKVTLARASHATDGGYVERIFEIKEKNLSCFPLTLDLVCRDSMDFFLNVGIWMGVAAPDWSAATAQQRDESGFWTDASGFCDSADYSSLNKSRWW